MISIQRCTNIGNNNTNDDDDDDNAEEEEDDDEDDENEVEQQQQDDELPAHIVHESAMNKQQLDEIYRDNRQTIRRWLLNNNNALMLSEIIADGNCFYRSLHK